jgi:hypothetical protein
VSPSLTGYTDPGEPAYPTFPTGSSIPQGLLSDRQEIFRGSVLAATPLCSDGTDDIALCELQVDGPVNTPEDKITPLAAGAQRLPTDRNGEYDVIIYAQSKSGQGYNPGVWRYEVGDPPSQSQTLSSLLGSTASFPVLINKGPLFSLSDSNCPRAGTLPVGCFRTLDDPSGKPLVIIGGDGSIIAAGGGNIIAAGSGNLTRDAINQIIAAGGANVVAAGGGNVARILDADGNVIGIIAAGGGNLAIIAAGGGNVIGAGGGNIIADAAGHIVSAGGGNIIAAGGGNIIAAGGGNIIAAGGGNITVAGADLGKMTGQNGFSFAAAFTGVAAAISGPLGSDQFTLSTTGVGSGGYQFHKLGSTGLTAAEAHKKHHRLTTISSGAVTITRKGDKATLLLSLTPAGRKLVAALAKRNATAARHHRHLAQLTVVLTETNRNSYGRTVTATRKFKVTPRMAHKPAPRH